jgi:DNA-binding LytR/AlgR family response regulator
MERMLPQSQFLRIHKSYIVAISKVTAAYGNNIDISQISLPVGRMYKEEVM